VPECGLADSRSEEQKAQVDYGLFLYQLGMTDADVAKVSQIESDLINMPEGFSVELKPSSIHGLGLFATKDFKIGEIVCPGRIDGKRTPGGRFINHAQNNNVQPKLVGDNIFAIASRKINAGDELLVDYRASMRVNFGFEMQGETL
jgi:SET domain-containing protein